MLKGLVFGAALAAMAGGALGVGPTGTMYVFDGDSPQFSYVQGTSVTNFTRQNYEFCAAITSEIRMIGRDPGQPGSKYDLAGNYLGTFYSNPFSGGLIQQALDGTTDGKLNYTTDYGGNRVVYADSDWSSGSTGVLFSASISGSMYGLTYDGTNDSFWVASSGGQVQNYSRGGTMLANYTYAGSSFAGIAYDGTDDTLWVGRFGKSFFQIRKSDGAILQDISISALGPNTNWGMEFATIPAPGSVALIGLAGLAASRRRRA